MGLHHLGGSEKDGCIVDFVWDILFVCMYVSMYVCMYALSALSLEDYM